MVKDRIIQAIETAPPDKRGYALRHRTSHGEASFSDLMTDLGPFIEEEIRKAVEAERGACLRVLREVEAAIADLRARCGV